MITHRRIRTILAAVTVSATVGSGLAVAATPDSPPVTATLAADTQDADNGNDSVKQDLGELSSTLGSSNQETNSSTLGGAAKSFGIGLGKLLGGIVALGLVGMLLNRLGLPH